MPTYGNENSDVFGGSRYLSSGSTSPRKPTSASRQNAHSPHPGGSSTQPSVPMDDDGVNSRHAQAHSLAHELAVALMPEPSAGSKLLAEEFGIEYDEGAEGIDEDGQDIDDQLSGNFANELGRDAFEEDQREEDMFGQATHDTSDEGDDDDSASGGSSTSTRHPHVKSGQDMMEILSENLRSTDNFISHLRKLDAEPGTGPSSTSAQPKVEQYALDVLRRINETTREREGQLRELFEYDREFRRISTEVGGTDVLSQLDEIVEEDIPEDTPKSTPRQLPSVAETGDSNHGSWDRQGIDDDDIDGYSETGSPVKNSFPSQHSVNGAPTPANMVQELVHLRSFTSSLLTSLNAILEQAQVDGAGTTDAGRKLRALKNRLGGWQTEADSAERSRVKIEKWEAGVWDGDTFDRNGLPSTPSRGRRREDGRKVVQEHLKAFEKALTEAGLKTQAIMAR
ncbi:hypothetical protein BJ138DRAFT_1145139 [Hygrophoropsis aurantiaca]|uniref:Uncharacterized protein n=1 Tax=Hygrophoropsis aurantiaca TaxID=72124 RepID=A0ACB8ALQ4_9AGAM|nr:hypothetical protein BJ138DRAFT_1145139 [Hygrophoropsis aurantiaca]